MGSVQNYLSAALEGAEGDDGVEHVPPVTHCLLHTLALVKEAFEGGRVLREEIVAGRPPLTFSVARAALVAELAELIFEVFHGTVAVLVDSGILRTRLPHKREKQGKLMM